LCAHITENRTDVLFLFIIVVLVRLIKDAE